jgi:hypothetical protein
MSPSSGLKNLAPDLWLLTYPLKTLGVDLQRNVTVIRLASGRLIIHSTAPFSAADVAAVHALGEPAWLIDTLLRHDTFAAEGRRAFPSATYFAPPGFSINLPFQTDALVFAPPEWAEEVSIASIDGAPEFSEIAMLHRPSRTLIVADLIFNFPGRHGLWTDLLLRMASVGGRHDPGVTVPFKKAITDRAAYVTSVKTVLGWDFDRVIVGHGEPIPSGGKEKLRSAILAAGFRELEHYRLDSSRNNISPALGT